MYFTNGSILSPFHSPHAVKIKIEIDETTKVTNKIKQIIIIIMAEITPPHRHTGIRIEAYTHALSASLKWNGPTEKSIN